MSSILNIGQDIQNALSSISSGLLSGLNNVANTIYNGFQALANFINQLPSSIQAFLETVASSITLYGYTIGAFLYNSFVALGNALNSVMTPIRDGIEWLGSSILNVFGTLWNDLKAFVSYIYNTTASAISSVVSVVQNIINDIKNTAVNTYNFLANIMNDIYNAFVFVFNAIFNLPQFFSQTAEFFNSLFSGGFGGSNLLNIVPGLVASEASRIALALPDVVAYNTFMEMMPKMIYGIANSPYFGNGIQGAFSKAMLMMASPVLSAFVAMFTKSFMDNLFTPARTTQTVSRPSTPQLQPFTVAPSAQLSQRSLSNASVSDVGQLQVPNLSPSQVQISVPCPSTSGTSTQTNAPGVQIPNPNLLQSLLQQLNSILQSQGANVTQGFTDSLSITPTLSMISLGSTQPSSSGSGQSSSSSGSSSSGGGGGGGTTRPTYT